MVLTVHEMAHAMQFMLLGDLMQHGVLSERDALAVTLDDRIQLPIVANSQDMKKLARSVAGVVNSDLPAVLVYQHRIYAWGKDPAEARRHLEIFEFLLEYAVQLHQLGL